jgi:uncharacterized protein (TIGR03545 family)
VVRQNPGSQGIVMRKRFLYAVLIPLVVIGLVLYFFFDGWVEAGLEYAGERAVGAKVEIDHLHITPFPIGMNWARLQVADPGDPWKNMFETRTVRFALDPGQLLRGKFIIETMEINELILGTKRTTDGSLPAQEQAPAKAESGGPGFSDMAKEALRKGVEKTPLSDPAVFKAGLNADSLLKVLDIRSMKHLDSLKLRAMQASQQWDATSKEFEASKQKLADVESGIKSINVNQLKTVEAITTAISTVDNSVKGIKDVTDTFSARKASIESDINDLSRRVGETEGLVTDDFSRLKAMAHLPNLNTSGIARMLVGDEMYSRAITAMHWIDVARSHIKNSDSKPPMETAPRMKGQDIRFPIEHAMPKFWVKKALISGGTDTSSGKLIRATGEILNITSDQRVTGLPMTASLRGVEGGGRTFSLDASFDRTKDLPVDRYSATLGNVPLAAFALGNSGSLAGKIRQASMNSTLSVDVPGNTFDANSRVTLSKFTLEFADKPKGVLDGIVRDVLSGISSFDVTLRMWTKGSGVDVALQTDLDDQIATRAQAVVGAELTKAQNQLKAKFDALVGAKRSEVEKLVADKKAAIEKQINGVQALVNDKKSMVDAKKQELTDRLEKEKKSKVEGLLKGLIKH